MQFRTENNLELFFVFVGENCEKNTGSQFF